MKQFTLRTILTTSFIFILVISISFGLIQRYLWLENHEIERIEQDYLPVAESLGKTVEVVLETGFSILSLAAEEVLKAGIKSKNAQEIVENIHYRNPIFKTVWVGDINGMAVAFSPLYDKDGNKNIGRNYSDREYYKKVKKLKKPVIGDILFGRAAKEMVIPLAAPILDKNGEFKGFVFAAYNPAALRTIIKSMKPYGKGHLILVDAEGKVVAHSVSVKWEEGLEDLSEEAIFKESEKKQKGVAKYISKLDKAEKIGAYYNLSNGWKIWISRDVKEIEKTISSLFSPALLWGIIAFFITLGIALVLSNYISKSVTMLKKCAEDISLGNFCISSEEEKRESGIFEINQLNSSFIKMAEELDSLYKELEKKVLERTVQLEDANKALEAASKAKSKFLANMSHELRTPLNSIIGFSDVLIQRTFGELNEKQSKYIGNINTSGRHLLTLINDILDLSKVEAGKMEVYLTTFPLNQLFTDVEIIIKGVASKKKINISVELADGLPEVIVSDPSKIKQILYNLLSNGIKFTPEGGSVRITARRVSSFKSQVSSKDLQLEVCNLIPDNKPAASSLQPATDFLEISVADTGIGIKKEDIDKLFKEFSQIDSSYTRTQAGTGLGLALCKKFVELLGGKIWVESEEGVGSTFSFTIPVEQEETKVTVEEKIELKRAIQPKPELTGKPLILVIEDDDKDFELIEVYLKINGYELIRGKDGEEALTLAKRYKFSAIVLDIILPKKSGWDVLAELKSMPETKNVPVVIVSVLSDKLFGLSLGAVDYHVKPVEKESLLHSLKKFGISEPKGKKILVVDDDPENVELVEIALKEAGFDVLKAYGGREGIDIIINQKPDAVILDLMMPEVSGFDVIAKVKKELKMEMPIILYTAKTLTAEEIKFLNSDIEEIIKKSEFSKECLIKEIEKAVGKG